MPPHRIGARPFAWAATLFALAAAAAEPADADFAFFESKIRPVFTEHCYSCHSSKAEKLKGELRLDSLEGMLKGGDRGPAIVPGHPEKSLLLKAVRYTDPELQMPPKNKKLGERQIAAIAQWIQSGAPWPAGEQASAPRPAKQEITEQDKSWWCFQPIRRPEAPPGRRRLATENPIDSFILAELAAKGLKPNPIASRRELIRRAYFDLIGLPPSPEQIAAFAKDKSSEAWPRVIDQLLSLPQYGERWGRHWLDVARFAQSNGYERDGEKPESWRYRDYVVKAFNEDKPYDQFIKEQIAGDELEPVTFDSLIATGFQRLGVWDDEPDDKRMAEFDELDDLVSTTGSAFLGLTIGCARCHDHKFDPIPQTDYYQLLSFFRNIRLSESARFTLDSPNYVPLAAPAQVKEWERAQKAKVKSVENELAAATNDVERKKLSKRIEEMKGDRPPFEWALAVRERGLLPPPTHVLIRGNAGNPGAEVQPAFLSVLGARRPVLAAPAEAATSTGRRRALAEWIASAGNPLTARVMVNRIWQHHFGQGLVKSTSDFGRTGALPTHPKLLDWLAEEFIQGGWSIKKMHKAIMLSQTYQRSSRTENAAANAVDPGNDLLWRQNLRRLEAEALRDTVLSISGSLNPRMGGRGFFPRLSGEVLAGQSRPGLDWEISSPEELSRRSLYAYVRRTMPVPMLDAFDYSNTASPLNERPVTTVAPQSLLLLNDAFVQQQAEAFAARITKEAGDQPEPFIARGFELAAGRGPTQQERQLSRDFIQRQQRAFAALQTRLTFRPDVPTSLSVSYLEKLKPEMFLLGPQSGWSYHRGRWSGVYEGIRTMERDRGPFALAALPAFSNGAVEARVVLHTACESAGILFRASVKETEAQGYEVAFEPREQRILLRRHSGELTTLAQCSAPIPTGQSLPLRIQFEEARLRVWLGENPNPTLDFTDSEPIPGAGRVGARAWGAAVSFDDLVLRPTGAASIAVRDTNLAAPDRRALQAFCLMLLNLNEVWYVD